MNKLLASKRM